VARCFAFVCLVAMIHLCICELRGPEGSAAAATKAARGAKWQLRSACRGRRHHHHAVVLSQCVVAAAEWGYSRAQAAAAQQAKQQQQPTKEPASRSRSSRKARSQQQRRRRQRGERAGSRSRPGCRTTRCAAAAPSWRRRVWAQPTPSHEVHHEVLQAAGALQYTAGSYPPCTGVLQRACDDDSVPGGPVQ
jgi:hypothetical protein